MMDGTYFDEHGNKFILKNDRWLVECCDEPRGLVGGICDFCGNEVQEDPEGVSFKQPTKMTDTPETDEEHQTMPMGGFTLDFARKLERQRDGLKSAVDCASDLLATAIAERDEARSRFNEIDLCQNGTSPCKWSLKLIAERDTAIAERDVLFQAIINLRDTKGRYHTQQAYESLMTLLPTNKND